MSFKGVMIQKDKYTITGIYTHKIIDGEKETFLINAKSTNQLTEIITTKKEEIKNKIDKAVKDFCHQFNIMLYQSTAKWGPYEDWFRGEEYIDSLPKKLRFTHNFIKKVYPTGIEFFKEKNKNTEPTVRMINFIKTRATEDISPQIAKEIKYIRNKMYRDNITRGEYQGALALFTQEVGVYSKEIRLHMKVEREQLKTQKALQKTAEMNYQTMKDIRNYLKKKK